jgi:cell division protein FtsL
LFIVLALTATGMALFALVVAQVFLGQAAFRQSRLQSSVSAKRLATEQLELEVAKLQSPDRIAARATQIGMVPATDVVTLTPPSTRSGPSLSRERR